MNHEINLLHHVGVVAKRLLAAETAAHEGDDNTPLGPTTDYKNVKNGLNICWHINLLDCGI